MNNTTPSSFECIIPLLYTTNYWILHNHLPHSAGDLIMACNVHWPLRQCDQCGYNKILTTTGDPGVP